MVMENLEMHKVRQACWDNDCYVIVKPLSTEKNPDTKLIMHRKGHEKLGDHIYKQDNQMWQKVDEIYLYMYKNFVN